jgi:peptidoglycan/LPS O-acetylase OafA/YrhL
LSVAPPLHPREARFYELDILRGLAAITVVFFHYKHFLLVSDAVGFDYGHMPFSTILMPFYLYGQFFVELFFAISGYVFFWLYARPIEAGQTDAWRFFVARFARLYPLYVVTLMIVAALQLAYRSQYGDDFIYNKDTPFNFVLNLLMVQQWIPYAVQSFNGPAWSISVEVFLYALFFALCAWRLNRIWVLAVLFGAGVVIRILSDPTVDFVRGVPSFFEGGLVFYAVQTLRKPANALWRKRIVLALSVLLPVLWGVSYARGFHPINVLVEPGLFAAIFSVVGFLYVVMPLSLLALGLMQDRWRTPWLSRDHLHKISWIGDISYSIYLIHFPLQLSLMLAMARLPFAERAQIFSSPLALLAFMAAAAGLGWLSFHYFEMPMRRYLQKRMRPALAPPSGVR